MKQIHQRFRFLHRTSVLLGTGLLLLGNISSAWAGGCFSTTPQGECVKWDSAQPVVWHPEHGVLKSGDSGGGGDGEGDNSSGGGGCGLMPQAQATEVSNAQSVQIIAEAFQRWMDVPNASLDVQQGDFLPDGGDVDYSNVENFWVGSFTTGEGSTLDGSECYDADPSNDSKCGPIIFDESGLITQAIHGQCAQCDILGFAAILPETDDDYPQFTISNPVLRNSQAVVSGACLEPVVVDPQCGNCCPEGIDLKTVESTMTHELGHFLGMDHTLVNKAEYLKCVSGTCTAAELERIPTMIGFFVPGADLTTLHYDDQVTFAGMYPDSDAKTCTIVGRAQTNDGESGRCFEVVAAREVDGQPSPEFSAATVAGAFAPRNSQGISCFSGANYNACLNAEDAAEELKVHTNCVGNVCDRFEIRGLGAGTYKIGVQAFQKNGNPNQPIDFILEPCTRVRTYNGFDNPPEDSGVEVVCPEGINKVMDAGVIKMN